MASTLDEETSFDGFNPLRYIVIECGGYEHHTDMAQETTFVDRYKAVARLEVKTFDEDNRTLYTSLRGAFTNRPQVL